MADKKSMLLLYEFEQVFMELESDEERGRLIMAMFAYERRGEEPDFTGVLRFAWRTHVKPKMDEMIQSYKDKCEKLRANVKKRWEKEKHADVSDSVQTDTNVSEPIQTDTNVCDKEKDKEKDKDIYNNPSISHYSESTSKEPVDNSVDNSESPKSGNAEPDPAKTRPVSLDGLDLYKLDSKQAFELFRSEYPRRQGALRDVQTAWVTTVAMGVLPGDLVAAARNYAAKCKRERTDTQYIKMPQTFLRDGWQAFVPKHSPICPRCHGQGVYEENEQMIMCNCDRRYAHVVSNSA